ncbi:MAG: hypothetical protein HY670_03110 [Chloroflexi bacterium]|nr:hypothetical protein [Chloroflexota bacterium]
MDEKQTVAKPLVQQIFDAMFADIDKRAEFSDETIQKLKHLTESDSFKKPNEIISAIKVACEIASDGAKS